MKNWWYAVKDAERSLWLPLLVGYQTASGEHREAEFTAEAWAFFKADYFRNERPQFGSCYERLKRAAGANGWVIPSVSSIKRKIEREIPKTHQVYLRKGEYAMSRMFPSMVRTVADMQAMEWVNGDGYPIAAGQYARFVLDYKILSYAQRKGKCRVIVQLLSGADVVQSYPSELLGDWTIDDWHVQQVADSLAQNVDKIRLRIQAQPGISRNALAFRDITIRVGHK
ncbi:DNA-binding domain-containing protein [Aggregatibacter actinomycetemcomitans]|uniref:DNA-binding domain-containing protein n=1 Tax=Aggregatibacter actinomycetemcomitans TaxID=714 RepID=UPI0039899D4C